MKKFTTIFVLAALAMSSHVMAATKTWTGASSNVWNENANWSPSGDPGSSDDVIIPGGLSRYPVLSGDKTVRDLTINGGSITTNNNDLTMSRYLIVNDGVINMGSGDLVADAIDLNGGEIIVRGNRLDLTGSAGADILTIDGGTLTITNADFEVNDDLFVFVSGILDLNGYDFLVTGSGKYTYIGGYVLSPGDFNMSNVEINFSGQHGLGINLRVTSNMTFTGGILETDNTHYITFDYNATVTGADDQSHVVGPVRKEISSGSGTNTFIFPLGDGTYYRPIQTSNYGNRRSADYFTAIYYSTKNSNSNGTLGSGLDHVSQEEYWDLSRGATSGTATTTVNVGLYYDEDLTSGPVTNATELRVAHWNGSSWDDYGRGGSSSSDNTRGWIYTNGNVSSFSPFTLGSSTSANPLPISLLNFNAELAKDVVNINWATSAELNNDYFLVEKSIDGINWNVIQMVEGAGTTESINNYASVDANPVNGVQYYRLKQVDFNGKFEYSAIVPVNFNGTSGLVKVFPIPANNNLNISLDNSENADVKIIIFNSFGQEVMSVNGTENFFTLDIAQLNAGIYTVEVKCENTLSKTKVIKN